MDGLSEHDIVNDPIVDVSKRENVLGMMMALAYLYDSGALVQNRHELQAQLEMSQFAVQITSVVSDHVAVFKN